MAEHEGLELLLRQSKLEINDDNAIEGGKIIQKLGYSTMLCKMIENRKIPKRRPHHPTQICMTRDAMHLSVSNTQN